MNFPIALIDVSFMIKVFSALVIGFSLGIEREYRLKPAGLKTYAMICLGATIFTHISLNIGENADPSRVAAQIVSGLGFIGAGAIFQSKRFISGLTTAATLWVVGALGTLVGMQWYQEAFYSIVLILAYFYMSRFIQRLAFKKTKYNLEILVSNKNEISEILKWFKDHHINILRNSWHKKDAVFKMELTYLEKKSVHYEILQELNDHKDVLGIHV